MDSELYVSVTSETGCKSEVAMDLLSRSGVSSTLMLRTEAESSDDKLVDETACEP